MRSILLLVPTFPHSGLHAVTLGFSQYLDNHGVISESISICDQQLTLHDAEQHYAQGSIDVIIEHVLSKISTLANTDSTIIIQGLNDFDKPFAQSLNKKLAIALNAEVILVTHPIDQSLASIPKALSSTQRFFTNNGKSLVCAAIVNKIGGPLNLFSQHNTERGIETHTLTECKGVPIIANIPWHKPLMHPRVQDILTHINASVINAGNIEAARISQVSLCARSVDHITTALYAGTLIITAGDRSDILVAACLAYCNGCALAGVLLTGGYYPNDAVLTLCKQAFDQGLTVLSTTYDSFTTTQNVQRIPTYIHLDDVRQRTFVAQFMAPYFQPQWLDTWRAHKRAFYLTPAAFIYQLSNRATQDPKRIILPEGEEPRIIEAAIKVLNKQWAEPILLGRRSVIEKHVETIGCTLPDALCIIEPDEDITRYVDALVEVRKHKGMTADIAKAQLQDSITRATVMLEQGEVDGMVAGAIHTTANTIRPALQIIKTAPGSSIVSSVFFMCLPHRVMVYGDCAINPHPSANQLAEIGYASAETAKHFGVDPKIAMISYATGNSSDSIEVKKVREATKIMHEKLPSLIIDGPIQYDAATDMEVALKKAPESPIKGEATVCIFPDLNTGNTTYKAVQRSAHVHCIGPVLQGLNKPVNDLSRGASVDDILLTILVTVIQAQV